MLARLGFSGKSHSLASCRLWIVSSLAYPSSTSEFVEKSQQVNPNLECGVKLATSQSGGERRMRYSQVLLTSATLFTVGTAEHAFAQGHEIPALNSCIREFLDPEMYNYLTFKNNCTHGVSLVFVAKDDSGATGSMELRAGAKDSVGRLANGHVPKVGDFQLYVCPAGSMPVDETGKVVSKPRSSFKCQAKSK